jgi:hypothetical protein
LGLKNCFWGGQEIALFLRLQSWCVCDIVISTTNSWAESESEKPYFENKKTNSENKQTKPELMRGGLLFVCEKQKKNVFSLIS